MNILIYFLWLLVAAVLQVLLFGHLSLFGGVIFIYLIALMKMPVEMNRIVQIVIGFLIGLFVDLFCNTLGMNALASVTIMLFRDPILHLYNNDPEFKNGSIGSSTVGMATYMRFALTMIAFHCFLLYFIESFTLFNLVVLFVKILISTAMTFIVTLAIEFASMKK